MDYTIRVLRKCKEYSFKVYMDPHQDIVRDCITLCRPVLTGPHSGHVSLAGQERHIGLYLPAVSTREALPLLRPPSYIANTLRLQNRTLPSFPP